MASAGRILIMPKGNYDANTEYEMLDLVFNGGASWVAKKNVVGIEPTDENTEHWMKMCESVDLTEVIQRIAALESQMLGTISLDDIDLSGYATKEDLSTVNLNLDALDGRLDVVEPKVTTLTSDVNTLKSLTSGLPSSFKNVQVVSYKGRGNLGEYQPSSVTFDFAPKVLFMLGYYNSTNIQASVRSFDNFADVIFTEDLTTSFRNTRGFLCTSSSTGISRYAKKSEDGKTISWYVTGSSDSGAQCDASGCTYFILGAE